MAVGGTWYLRTKEMDFFPESLIDSDSSSEVKSPVVGPPRPDKTRIVRGEAPKASENLEGFKSLRFDEDSALEAFSSYKQKGAMEAAYLVGERVLENAQLSLNDKSDIAEEMSSYLATLRPCLVEGAKAAPLSLTLRGLELKKEKSDLLVLQLKTILRRSSGGLVDCSINFKEGDEITAAFVVNKNEFSGEIPQSGEINDLIPALYQILHKQVMDVTEDLSLPSWSNATISQFETGVTRFAWSQLILEQPQSESRS